MHPHLRWQGDGYFDINRGDAPLEQGFSDWQWARGATRDGTAILYEPAAATAAASISR